MYVLLSFVTFSVYHFYFMDLWAKDVNILCEKDGKHTVGVEKMMLVSVLTFGVYKYVWLAEIVDRICDNAAEYDVEVRQDSGESDDFDWSQIQSEFDSLKDEFPS